MKIVPMFQLAAINKEVSGFDSLRFINPMKVLFVI